MGYWEIHLPICNHLIAGAGRKHFKVERIMWKKLLEFFKRLFSINSVNPSAIEEYNQSDSKSPEKLPALPITDKYEKIDWENKPPQYRKRNGVLTFREREFYRVLRSLMGRENHILSMVRMADVLWLSNETEDRRFHNNNILCKHFDYVICDKLKFEPILVVELDDPKHQWEHRWQIDKFKDKACEVAGLPIVRIEVQDEYDKADIEREIQKALNSVSQGSE